MKKFLLVTALSMAATATVLVVRQVLKDMSESEELWTAIVDEIGTDKLGAVKQS